MSRRRRAFLDLAYEIAAIDFVVEGFVVVDGVAVARGFRGPCAGLPPDARAAFALMLEREHERGGARA